MDIRKFECDSHLPLLTGEYFNLTSLIKYLMIFYFASINLVVDPYERVSL